MMRLLRRVTALASLGLGVAAGTASAQQVTPAEAPATWIAYAELVSREAATILGGDDARALNLRKLVQSAGATPVIKLSLWIGPDGIVTRVEAATGVEPAAGEAARSLLKGLKLSQVPPAGILLPLRIAARAEDTGADRGE
ncbi:hypothetical protein [Sphingomonas sp. KR3-1]|uniref:hypothetical protein n=1 Tax=Sphingomonas sp. KR3-1 TaxID=3156611 RepID=UPI0032B52EAB